MQEVVDSYIENVTREFHTRVKSWSIDFEEEEKFLVVAGSLTRQLTLCISVVRELQLWNWDLGLMVIRLMSSVYIDLAWISSEPQKRAKMFIDYGTGQGLLDLEHKRVFERTGEVSKSSLAAAEAWLSSQRKEIFTEVNLASWSGVPVSQMASESSSTDVYEGFYIPASTALHSTWYHLFKGYLVHTENEGWSPSCPSHDVNPDILFLSARLMDKTFHLTDKLFPSGVSDLVSSYETLRKEWKEELNRP